jgi:hypothetical protein
MTNNTAQGTQAGRHQRRRRLKERLLVAPSGVAHFSLSRWDVVHLLFFCSDWGLVSPDSGDMHMHAVLYIVFVYRGASGGGTVYIVGWVGCWVSSLFVLLCAPKQKTSFFLLLY